MSKKKKSEAWGENGFEDWGGYMAAKQAKLEEQFQIEANKEFNNASNIFQGIAIFVNGYTDPTADELRRLMMTHGGIYHHYMRPRVTTHIIASNLPYSKILLYRKSQNPIPICKPQWIVDSIKAGRVLNFQHYLLYSSSTNTQPQLKYKIQNKTNVIDNHLKMHDKKQRDNDLNMLVNDNDNQNTVTESTTTNENVSHPIASLNSRDAQSTKNSEFISEFYSHSRLHHISTMGAAFKDYVNELRDQTSGKFPGLTKLKDLRDMNQESIIMHIDMDCFFVSVGLRNKPELRGLPVAVTHAKGNKQLASNSKEVSEDELGSLSEVASCSYEARKAGVKNGMFLGEALKLCPSLKTIPYDFEGYKEVSYTLYNTVASYTLDIEAVSCDEMYAECTKILEEYCLTPMEFASVIREEIKQKTGCPVSTGFGGNKLLARLATRKAKPDGQFYLKENLETYIGTFNVQDLPGVGWTTTNRLNTMNIRTCAELQTISLATLQKEFGKKMGEVLHNMCRGVDYSKLNLEHIRKSVSAEVNYGIRFESNADAVDFLKRLSVEVSSRLRKANARGRCITLKLLVRAKEAPKETAKFMGHGLCDYMTKSKNVISPIDDSDIIAKEVIVLWNQMLKVPEDARGIGIQITRLEIRKGKSRDMSLTSFVNKIKESNTVTRSAEINTVNEVQSSKDANSDVAISTNTKVDIPSNIDESILSELPEEIRNEILDIQRNKHTITATNSKEETTLATTSAPKIKEKKSENRVQTQQENFFKQTKPGVSRSAKVEMPPIHDIDMSVLIELPEDIRNEILNEYRVNRNQNRSNSDGNENDSGTSLARNTNTIEFNPEEQNISFSQVDPEFLAALSEDLKRDVQMYCTANKKKTGTNDNIMKESKKIERKTKNNGKSSKVASSKNNKKNRIHTAFRNLQNKNESVPDQKYNNGISKSVVPHVERIELVNNQVTPDEAKAILSHNRTISENNEDGIQHQDILIDLVNRLLNLPLEQVVFMINLSLEIDVAWFGETFCLHRKAYKML
ncbi:DNA repair protein REV1 [Dufourea novaeangliae]|uniref:DNA repair protein REV1 n=1 Tax=Dufourea novaeangliae TaxID=178035 RepID=A0A154PH18_DUFNO|nr:DNA repair protein REV1 [Dufourea novaeangliae]